MAQFNKNEATAAFRRVAIYIYVDDGVTPAPLATTFTTGAAGNTQVRQGGTSYADAGGTLTNAGIDGEWIYEATQAETNFNGTELGIKIAKAGFLTTIVEVGMLRATTSTSVWDEVPGSLVAGSYGEMTARPIAQVVTDVSNSPTTFVTNLASSATDAYKDTWVVFLSGALIGQCHKVTAYNGTTKALTFTTAFSTTPSNTDRFLIINK